MYKNTLVFDENEIKIFSSAKCASDFRSIFKNVHLTKGNEIYFSIFSSYTPI